MNKKEYDDHLPGDNMAEVKGDIESITDRIRATTEMLDTVYKGAKATADRIFGARPEQAEPSKDDEIHRNGILWRANEQLEELKRVVLALQDEVCRFNRL